MWTAIVLPVKLKLSLPKRSPSATEDKLFDVKTTITIGIEAKTQHFPKNSRILASLTFESQTKAIKGGIHIRKPRMKLKLSKCTA